MAHSDCIQDTAPHLLNIYYQYIKLDSYGHGQILYINHDNNHIFLLANTIIGHVEPMNSVLTIS